MLNMSTTAHNIRIVLVMQVRIGLIPLITSTFVFYTWGLPGNAAITILMFLTMKLIYFENTLVKPSFFISFLYLRSRYIAIANVTVPYCYRTVC
jgi:uncharacterized membrane protein